MNSREVPDRFAREAAETTFDRNVVVIAGAGTGKTTLLVNRLVHLLVKEPSPVPVTRIVALTFTNKAATEMKQRLRERLTVLSRPAPDPARMAEGGAVSVESLRERYGLTTDEIAGRAGAGLRDLEKAQIGTLHSFAAHLLRLYPLESGVDPSFQEDDGLRFEEHFAAAWDIWMDQELGRHGLNHRRWKTVLRVVDPDDLRTFVRCLCSELIELCPLSERMGSVELDPHMAGPLETFRDRAQALLDARGGINRRKIEHMLAASCGLLTRLLERGSGSIHELTPEEEKWLMKDLGAAVSGWESGDFSEAARIIGLAQSFLQVDQAFFNNLLSLIVPLVERTRTSFARKGWLSFDGLLARARTLLRDHPAVRERIKREYGAVLVDEFQDTDPVQYEIILSVAERIGTLAPAWRNILLEPGKLFIVGDPKQSIYAFRRADIEAFDRVVRMIEADHGLAVTLTTNFRSDAAVLGPVNDIFDRLFEERLHVQPPNVRLEVRPRRRILDLDPGVRLQVVTAPEDEPLDAAGAVRAEAELLARWLKDDILARPAVRPGHVALLFRKLTQADLYLDALRRQGIPYVIEGEKHFYRRQEVIDFVNVLRVLDQPHDAIALVGVLRSPIGGLSDRDVYELRQAGLFDYRRAHGLASWSRPCAGAVRRLYGRLDRLHRNVGTVPLGDAVRLVIETLPFLELAAASLHGEQAVANLLKIKQLAAGLSDRPQLTLSGFADLMTARLEEQPEEAESPLAEESPEAVQVLTIHKAKGLEFPIVVLPGLHQGAGRERSAPMVISDWSTGLYGLSLGDRRTLSSVLLQEKLAIRQEAERRRVLYVGMTRAKDLLLLSGGMMARPGGDSVLSLLQAIGQGDVGARATPAITVGQSAIPQRVVEAPTRISTRRRRAETTSRALVDPAATAALWQAREAVWRETLAVPGHLTPTSLSESGAVFVSPGTAKDEDRDLSRLVGIIAHRMLERWDFTNDPALLTGQIDGALRLALAPGEESLTPKLTAALQEVFTAFGRSDLYLRLRAATILGREVPFILPWGRDQVMEGVIDIIYRLDGRLWIADYKTDSVTLDEAPARAERYRKQSDIYKLAVRQSLSVDEVGFQCFFLRCATAIEL
jgi:ATP-dependent helicase/nuclease subunit A